MAPFALLLTGTSAVIERSSDAGARDPTASFSMEARGKSDLILVSFGLKERSIEACDRFGMNPQ